MKKHLGIIITISTLLIGAISSFHVIRIRGEETEKKVIRLEEDINDTEEKIEKTKEEVIEEAKVNIAQTVRLENLGLLLQKLDKKLDKDLKDE